MEGDMISMEEIFSFEQTGKNLDLSVRGRFRARGIRPKFVERFTAFGIQIDPGLFDPAKVYEI